MPLFCCLTVCVSTLLAAAESSTDDAPFWAAFVGTSKEAFWDGSGSKIALEELVNPPDDLHVEITTGRRFNLERKDCTADEIFSHNALRITSPPNRSVHEFGKYNLMPTVP